MEPEQIAAHLRETFPERPAWHLCHETAFRHTHWMLVNDVDSVLADRTRTVEDQASWSRTVSSTRSQPGSAEQMSANTYSAMGARQICTTARIT